MSLIELFLLAAGLSMDAFAVSICSGLTMKKVTVKKALIVGLYFGIFQAWMPLFGYLVTILFADKIVNYNHYVAFILLGFLGGKMIIGSFDKGKIKEILLIPTQMLPLALATSIDAMAAGVSFAVLSVEIIPAISLIGVTTLIMSMVGVKIGQVFGTKFRAKAELIGGVVLLLIGLKILIGGLIS